MTPEILLVGTNESNKLFAETQNEFSGQEDADYLVKWIGRPIIFLLKKLPLLLSIQVICSNFKTFKLYYYLSVQKVPKYSF